MDFAWDDLRLFLAVARAGTLAGAARTLGVNHSTVFRRLNALEERLQTRLFDRLAEGYRPTVAGESLRGHAERMEETAQAVERELQGQDVRLSGTITVTTTNTLANRFLAPMFERFVDAWPDIRLEVLVSGANLDLSRHEADLAIRPTNAPPDNLVGRRLGTLHWGLYGARGYLAARPPVGEALEGEGHRFIGGSTLIGALGSTRWLDARVPAARVALRTNSIQAALGAAAEGTGLAVLPHYMARAEPALCCVQAIPADQVSTALWLLYHPDLRATARVRAFMAHAVAALEAQRWDLETPGPEYVDSTRVERRALSGTTERSGGPTRT